MEDSHPIIAGLVWGEAHYIAASALVEANGSVSTAASNTVLPLQDFYFSVATMVGHGLFAKITEDLDIDKMTVAPTEIEEFMSRLDRDVSKTLRDFIQGTRGRDIVRRNTRRDESFSGRRTKKQKKGPYGGKMRIT